VKPWQCGRKFDGGDILGKEGDGDWVLGAEGIHDHNLDRTMASILEMEAGRMTETALLDKTDETRGTLGTHGNGFESAIAIVIGHDNIELKKENAKMIRRK
jgi:hypothetical protein